MGGPAFAGEAAVALGDAGVGLGEGVQGALGVVAGVAEAVCGERAEGDLVFAAAAAVPGGHSSLLALSAMMSQGLGAPDVVGRRRSQQEVRGAAGAAEGRAGSGRAARSMTTRWT